MNRVAFYLENRTIASVDCSGILSGNPGIGGTQYMITVVSYLLSVRDNGLTVKTFVQSETRFPEGFRYSLVNDFSDAVRRAEEEGFECLVFRHDADLITGGVLDSIKTDIKLVVWDHVFACYWEHDYYARKSSIYKVINVGREMNDLYMDHQIFRKSAYIYNCLNFHGIREIVRKREYSSRKNIVVYVGCLMPYKGFHLLAEAWPRILAEVPDAELYVIGSGKLYDRTSKYGSYGLADAEYETEFMRYLSRDGEILPSVHFMGDMGLEKNDILIQAKVGVPNPSGVTETFCLSAVEMQMFGAKIATIDAPGFLDTVKNGLLYKNAADLADTVVRLLNTNNNDAYEAAMDFFEENFSQEAVVSVWEKFFNTGNTGSENEPVRNKAYRLKWLKLLRRKLSSVLPFLYLLPPTERMLIYFERKFLRKTTYMDS